MTTTLPRTGRRRRLGIIAAAAAAVVAGSVAVTAVSYADVQLSAPGQIFAHAYGGQETTLNWNAVDGASAYEVYRDGRWLADSGDTTFSEPRPDYITRYSVRAFSDEQGLLTDPATFHYSDSIEIDYVPPATGFSEPDFQPENEFLEFTWTPVKSNPDPDLETTGLAIDHYIVRREAHPVDHDGRYLVDRPTKYTTFTVYDARVTDRTVVAGYNYWYYIVPVNTGQVPGDNLAVAVDQVFAPDL